MRARIAGALVAALVAHSARALERPLPPQVEFGDLYAAVELAGVFPDSKEFADATPNAPPADILALYQSEKPATPEALRRFVLAHFDLPEPPPPASAESAGTPIRRHIEALWPVLTRSTRTAPPYSSLLSLPRPYVVPGGRFRELYYWDSYFTMLGLAESGRTDLLEDMAADFAYLIDAYGHIPNGTRSYYLSRSQPPFFYAMVGLLSPADPAASYARYLPQLRKEYAFWMDGADSLGPGQAHRRVVKLDEGAVLNRYFDDSDLPRDESYAEDVALARSSPRPSGALYRDLRAGAESGWDFGSRWFSDGRALASIHTTDIAPVDLNALMFGLESAIAMGCERTGDRACAADFAARTKARRAAIDRFLFDPDRGVYLDYDWTRKTRDGELTAATLYPLFTHAASEGEAASVGAAVGRQLLKPGGIVTTTVETGQQWDAPNGWAPLQWIAVAGLRAYGRGRLAEAIACRFMANVERVYRQTGKLVEKYDVIDAARPGGGGEYPTQDGFGWTNGVMLKLMALYPSDADLESAESCPTAE